MRMFLELCEMGFQDFLRAARGDQLHPVRGKEAGKIHQSGLVGNAQDGAANGKHIHGQTPLLTRIPALGTAAMPSGRCGKGDRS